MIILHKNQTNDVKTTIENYKNTLTIQYIKFNNTLRKYELINQCINLIRFYQRLKI